MGWLVGGWGGFPLVATAGEVGEYGVDMFEYAGEKEGKRLAEWSGNSVRLIRTLGLGVLGELPEGGRTPARPRSAAHGRLHRTRGLVRRQRTRSSCRRRRRTNANGPSYCLFSPNNRTSVNGDKKRQNAVEIDGTGHDRRIQL